MSEKPLVPWFISMTNGRLLAAHCNCTAGLGETCSHVATLLWLIAVGVEKRESLSVTQKKAYWVMPPPIRSVPFSPINSIEFIGKKTKSAAATNKRQIGDKSTSSNKRQKGTIPSVSSSSQLPKGNCSSAADKTKCTSKHREVAVPTDEEQKQFLDSLASCSKAKPAVLSVLPGYCDKFVPDALSSELPQVLTDLYKPENLSLSYYELLEQADKTEVTATTLQCKAAEMITKEQSSSRIWFRLRAGRVTASRFKSVCCTDPANPSLSLIMNICHPEKFRFKSAATSYGCQHEKDALLRYSKASSHDQVCVSSSGLRETRVR